MTITNTLIRHFEPQIAALLSRIRRAEKWLGPSDDWIEDDRRVLFQAADPIARKLGRSTVTEVSARDYTYTVEATPDEVERALAPDYQRNLLSTRKYRTHHDGGRQWAVGSWVFDPPGTEWQHHVILFRVPNGRTDIYAHREASVRDPSEHHHGKQIPGDPNRRIQYNLAAAGIKTYEREL